VVSFRDLFSARRDQSIQDVMRRDVVTARDDLDQEALSDLFARHNLMMIPVIDAQTRIKGVVTHDDIIDVLREEATEDIQKIGGMAALEAPYLQIPLSQMIKKRGDWLAGLFIGEMLTTTAMGYYGAICRHACRCYRIDHLFQRRPRDPKRHPAVTLLLCSKCFTHSFR
jgi:magnesium transporter